MNTVSSAQPDTPPQQDVDVVDAVKACQLRIHKAFSEAMNAVGVMVATAGLKDEPSMSTYMIGFELFLRHAGHEAQDIGFACVQGKKAATQFAKKQMPLDAAKEQP